MSKTRDRSIAFISAIEKRLANRQLPFPGGVALFRDDMPEMWFLNFCLIKEATALSAEELGREANRLHHAAGHQHRQITVHHEPTGRRLESEFRALGWENDSELLMARRRPPDRSVDSAEVEEVDERVLQPLRERIWRREPWAEDAGEEAVRQLLAAQFLLDGATSVTRFAARPDGELSTFCDLYRDGPTAQIESVVTLPEFRNQGLARAVVSRAVDEAEQQGADLVFLTAYPDDWPKELYRRLGFDEIGYRYTFRLTVRTLIRNLLDSTGASRVTLRQDRRGDVLFPVTHEVRGEGVRSIRDGAGVSLRGQPVVKQLEETRAQVIQDDCATAFDDPDFQRMREAYGGLAAQIVTPLVDEGRIVGVLSLHQLGRPRSWIDEEKRLAAEVAEAVLELIRA